MNTIDNVNWPTRTLSAMRKNVATARTRAPIRWKCVMPNRPGAQPIRSNVVQVAIASVGISFVTAGPIVAMVATKNAP